MGTEILIPLQPIRRYYRDAPGYGFSSSWLGGAGRFLFNYMQLTGEALVKQRGYWHPYHLR